MFSRSKINWGPNNWRAHTISFLYKMVKATTPMCRAKVFYFRGNQFYQQERMEISLVVPYAALCAVTLMTGWLVHWVYKWINPPCNGTLPPGSMGLPIIGETMEFFKMSASLDIPDFYKQRMQRWVYKSVLLMLSNFVIIGTRPFCIHFYQLNNNFKLSTK